MAKKEEKKKPVRAQKQAPEPMPSVRKLDDENAKPSELYKLVIYDSNGTIINAIRTNDVTFTSQEGDILDITDWDNADDILGNPAGYKVDPKTNEINTV